MEHQDTNGLPHWDVYISELLQIEMYLANKENVRLLAYRKWLFILVKLGCLELATSHSSQGKQICPTHLTLYTHARTHAHTLYELRKANFFPWKEKEAM